MGTPQPRAQADLCQYLLTNPRAIRAYVDALDLTPVDSVLEVGGGKGTITEEIILRDPQLVETVDLDASMAAALAERFAAYDNVTVTCGDGLEAIRRVHANALVCNLPISMTEQTLGILFSSASIHKCVMVADRTAAEIMLPSGWHARDIADFSGDDFTPSQPVVSHAVALWKDAA